MSSIQELREETYKVIHETEQGGNSASRIGNLYNGIIDFLGILDDRTVNPYYYDDTALKEAIRRVDAAIAELDRTLDAALVLVNQERQRLDDLVNSIDGEITEKVDEMLNDAEWLQQHAQGIQQMVNEGEIEWKSEWDQNVEAYLQEVGVWARDGDVIKTQWTEIVQSVNEISSTVAEVQTDLAGRPTSTQWTQITQKVNGIEQSVNALLYEGETTEALQSSINQSIDGKVASLNLETTYAKIDTEDSKEVIEWMYSALRNETTSEKTFNDIVSAGKSGLMNGVSNIHTYVEVVRNGEVLDYVAGSSIEAKVNDAVTGLYNKASAGDAQTTIFSQVKKDTSDIATIVTHATGDYTSASIATKFDTWKSGLALKTDIDSAKAELVTTMDEKDNASALILESKISESSANLITRMNNATSAVNLKSTLEGAYGELVTANNISGYTSGFITEATFDEAMAGVVAKDDYNAATIVAYVNESGSGVQIAANKINMTGNVFQGWFDDYIDLKADDISFEFSNSWNVNAKNHGTVLSLNTDGELSVVGNITAKTLTLENGVHINGGCMSITSQQSSLGGYGCLDIAESGNSSQNNLFVNIDNNEGIYLSCAENSHGKTGSFGVGFTHNGDFRIGVSQGDNGGTGYTGTINGAKFVCGICVGT